MLKNINFNEEFNLQNKTKKVLLENFPNCFTRDGQFDLELFKNEILSDVKSVTNEGYGLNWIGKNYAKLISELKPTTMIQPRKDHNEQVENAESKNLYIVGDNLEVLKHLRNAYRAEINVMYVDLPYNTGSDEFGYKDDFLLTKEDLIKMGDYTEEEAERIINFTSKGSNSHSAWLTFVYSRLLVARELLKDDGVIFISIDDNEQAQLKLLCNDVFGEHNFVSQIIVQSNKRGQTYKDIAKTHEYVFVYTKDEDVVINKLEKEIGEFKKEDKISGFSERELRNRNPKYGKFNRPNLFYPIYVNPNIKDKNGYHPISLEKNAEFSIEVLPLNSKGKESCWRWGKKKFNDNNNPDSMLSNIVGKKKRTGEYGIYEKYRKTKASAKTIWFEEDLSSEGGSVWGESEVISEQGSVELGKLNMGEAFDFPKPVALIKRAILLGSFNYDDEEESSDKSITVMDFFSGSGTTAQAVLELNNEDEGDRNFICVQLPEDLDEKLKTTNKSNKPNIENVIKFLDNHNKPHSLAEIGIIRIQRVIERMKAEGVDVTKLGFKIFDISKIEEETLVNLEDFKDELFSSNEILNKFDIETLLYTWMLEDGIKITEQIETVEFDKYIAYKLNDVLYLMESNISDGNAIQEIIRRIETEEEFIIKKLVLFGYSFTTNEITNIKENFKHLINGNKSSDILWEVRY